MWHGNQRPDKASCMTGRSLWRRLRWGEFPTRRCVGRIRMHDQHMGVYMSNHGGVQRPQRFRRPRSNPRIKSIVCRTYDTPKPRSCTDTSVLRHDRPKLVCGPRPRHNRQAQLSKTFLLRYVASPKRVLSFQISSEFVWRQRIPPRLQCVPRRRSSSMF